MNKRLSITLFLAPAFAGAQQLGTKKDVMVTNGPPASSSTSGLGQVVPLIIALFIVFAIIKWGLPGLIKYVSKKSNEGSTIHVRDSAIVGGSHIHVVSVMGKTLLLGSSPTGVNLIADLTASSEVQAKPLFAEILHEEANLPATAPFVLANESDPDQARISEALSRLERLVGA